MIQETISLALKAAKSCIHSNKILMIQHGYSEQLVPQTKVIVRLPKIKDVGHFL